MLYEGRQIFFGKTTEAKEYFEALGFVCPQQQTTADFLTSMTSHQERIIRPGWEGKTPRTPEEFSRAWKASLSRQRLVGEIEDYMQRHPFDGEHYEKFAASRRIDQSKSQRAKSPFTLSYMEQMRLTLWRSWVMLLGDPSITLTMLITNLFEALIISSLFYNMSSDSASMFRRGILLFFIVMINAFASILEMLTMYAKRRIVEKHSRYALYHPSAEALSSMVVDLPYKIVNCILLNTTLYFMSNLRREPGPFFFFLLVSFCMTLSMSMMFRLIASLSRSLSQALAPASVLLLAIALYAGFAIPPAYMKPWFGWLRWINPVYYGFESLIINEFVGRNFSCASFVPSGPGYEAVAALERVCSEAGSVPGQSFVQGGAWLSTSFGFQASHRWRNFGVIIAFTILFMGFHLVATEYIAAARSKGEVLVFTRKAMNKRNGRQSEDIESGKASPAQVAPESDSDAVAHIEKQTSIFHWKDVCYDIKIKGEDRRILDHVDGWVKPGTLTALMVSGMLCVTADFDVNAANIVLQGCLWCR